MFAAYVRSISFACAGLLCAYTGVAGAQVEQWTKYTRVSATGSVSTSCGGYGARNITSDQQGNVFVVGGDVRDNRGLVVSKFDFATGALVWTNNYSPRQYDSMCAADVAVDASGNVVVVGKSQSYGDGDLTAKYDGASGELIWAFTDSAFFSNEARRVALDATGNVFVLGAGVSKLDGANGNRLWRHYPSSGAIAGGALAIDTAGDVYFTTTDTSSYPNQALTTKLRQSDGVILWHVRHDSAAEISASHSIKIAGPNEIVVAGLYRDLGNGGLPSAVVTTKLNASTGAQLWVRRQTTASPFAGRVGVAVDFAGNVIVNAIYLAPGETGNAKQRIAKYSSTGDLGFLVNTLNLPVESERSENVYADSSGNIFVFGLTQDVSQPTSRNVAQVTKISTTGVALWSSTRESPSISFSIAADGFVVLPNQDAVTLSNVQDNFGSRLPQIRRHSSSNGDVVWNGGAATVDGRSVIAAIVTNAVGDVFALGGASDSDDAKVATFVAKFANAGGAETWRATTVGVRPGAIAQNTAGDVLIGTLGSNRATVHKYNGATGAQAWVNDFASTTRAGVNALATDANGDVYAAGGVGFAAYSGQDTTFPLWRTVKIDGSTGQTLWTANYAPTESVRSISHSVIAIGVDGHPVAAVSFDEGGKSYYAPSEVNGIVGNVVRVNKYDKQSGAPLWSRSIGQPDATFRAPMAIRVDAHGNIFVLVVTKGVFNSGTAFLRLHKLSPATGATVASLMVGEQVLEHFRPLKSQLQLDASGNPVVSFLSNGVHGNQRATVVKLNAALNGVIWTGAFGAQETSALAIAEAGNVFVAGYSNSGLNSNDIDIRVAQFNGTDGAPVWNYSWDGGLGESDVANAVAVPQNGDVFVAGAARSPGLQSSGYLQKINPGATTEPYKVYIAFQGTGEGRVGIDAGFGCTSPCDISRSAGATVTLLATPISSNDVFVGWSGACSGTAPQCVLTVNGPKVVTATFVRAKTMLNVAFTGNGYGSVSFSTIEQLCTGTCAFEVGKRTPITLRANANADSGFSGWGGACATYLANDECTIALDDVSEVTAYFSYGTARLTIASSPFGEVTSTPAGVFCGARCTSTFPVGTVVTLAATPSAQGVFRSWNHPGCIDTPTCQVVVNGATNIFPNFEAKTARLEVTRGGGGRGRVLSYNGAIACGAICSADYSAAQSLTLYASPATNSRFVGWSGGGCSGDSLCTPTFGSTSVAATFVRVIPDNDLNADAHSDILGQRTDGTLVAYLVNNGVPFSSVPLFGPGTTWRVTHMADLNGDGRADLVFQNTDGSVYVATMNGLNILSGNLLLGPGTGWRVAHAADFNGDGTSDLLLENANGAVYLYNMNGVNVTGGGFIIGGGTTWRVTHTGDLNGDGNADLVFQNTDGSVYVATMNGTTAIGGSLLLGAASGWSVTHVADLNGDSKSDLVLRNTNGAVYIYTMNGVAVNGGGFVAGASVALGAGTSWRVVNTGDFNRDGSADLVLQHPDGSSYILLMNGTNVVGAGFVQNATSPYRVTHVLDFNGDGRSDVVLRHAIDGTTAIFLMNGTVVSSVVPLFAANSGITIVP